MSAKLYKGNSPISKIHFGNKVVSAIYRGSALLWQGIRVFQDWMGQKIIDTQEFTTETRETYTMPNDAIDIEISIDALVFSLGSAESDRNNTFSILVNGTVIESISQTAQYETIDGSRYCFWHIRFSTIPSLKKGDVLSYKFGEPTTLLFPLFEMTMKLI